MKNFQELSERKNLQDFVKSLDKMNAEELAVVLGDLSDEVLALVCPLIDSELMAEVLVAVDKDFQQKIISCLTSKDLKEVMDEVSVEDTVDIIEEMPGDVAMRIAEQEEIVELVKEKKYAVLKPIVHEMNPADLASLFDDIPHPDMLIVFRLLSKEQAAETFVEMGRDLQRYLIDAMSDNELRTVLDELFMDDTVDIIEEMPSNVVRRIIGQSGKETRRYINELLKYPKDSAGSIMTVEVVSLKSGMTVKDAFEKIRSTGIDKETIYTCYVTDDKNKLIGVVTAKNLMLSDPDTKIGDIMKENPISVDTLMDREDVVSLITKYGFLALPVVDQEERLVGIVTVDDALTIMQQETSEDIAKMGAVTPSDTPYLKTSVWRLWANRAPWLMILMLSATFTGLIISANEETLNMATYGIILTACIPMLMDTGGNAGSQASVTIIRSIALKEISFKDLPKVVWKEFKVSILLGLTLAIGCFAKLMAVDRLWSYDNGFVVAAVICVTMFLTLVIAKFIGCTLPIIAKKLRLDPAVVASPFITTIVDAVSLIIYCGIAVSVLGAL